MGSCDSLVGAFQSAHVAARSADKQRQVWSPHFGHCQKSLRAHDDAVTGLAFLPGTHVAVSCGKDKAVKLWDLDRYEQAHTRAKSN